VSNEGPYQVVLRAGGPIAAAALCRAYGGRRIKIPRTISPEHRIAQAIGHTAALALASAFGGEQITVPLYDQNRERQMRRVILDMLRDGSASANAIAAAVGCHVRTVYKLRGELRDTRQLDLFASKQAEG